MAAELVYDLAADAQRKMRVWLQLCSIVCSDTDTAWGCLAFMQTARIMPAGPTNAWSKSSSILTLYKLPNS